MNIVLSLRDQEEMHYEIECILRMFLPDVRPCFTQEEAGPGRRLVISTGGGSSRAALEIPGFSGEETEPAPAGGDRKELEVSVCRMIYRLLCRATGRRIQWGVLTGIRPVKLVRELREGGMTYPEIFRRFTERYLTAPEKAELCIETDKVQREATRRAGKRDYSLYISIPFCPSRCGYCSFVTHSIEKTGRLIPEYLDRLEEELACTARIAAEKGLTLRTIYMGGGTPTILEAEQLERLLDRVNRCFDRENCLEFTVEAGRPDTITEEKLAALARGGVDRISVNPQTLDDRVLEAIGRRHTAADFYRAYEEAQKYPFASVNVDLIAGLTGDTPESFRDTLDKVISLDPGNITVHALTMKRAADMIGEKNLHLSGSPRAEHMINYSQEALKRAGYRPYYLYRQKSTVDSLENVGFCKGGLLCLYNVYIMDETHTILSVGGGGVTKVVLPGNRIERIFNYKYPYEYISRFPTILERKDKLYGYDL